MTSEEPNSAELKAEEILRDALQEARAETCPQGEACPVHFRVNEEYFEGDSMYARMITYLGEYVVITEDNPAFYSPSALFGIIMGGAGVPMRWETTVVHVGSGVIADIVEAPAETGRRALRYTVLHDDWDDLPGFHDTIVSAVASGMLDLSGPQS